MGVKTIWGGLTPITKWIIIGAILALIMIGAAVFILWQSSSFEDREREREEERRVLIEERDALIKERDRFKLEAAESTAKADALALVAQDKKANMDKAIKEISEIEANYEKRKQELEAQGGSMSDADLQRALCEDLRRAGFKITCTD